MSLQNKEEVAVCYCTHPLIYFVLAPVHHGVDLPLELGQRLAQLGPINGTDKDDRGFALLHNIFDRLFTCKGLNRAAGR